MLEITLDAGSTPPQGVSPQPVLRLIIGNPPREMLIVAGSAFLDWKTDSGKLIHDEIIIKLGVTSTPHFQATSTVALAAIYNTDSDFIFAADDSIIEQDALGQLQLRVQLGLMGDSSDLLKVNYHVQVISDPLESFISGTIRWAEELGEPTLDAQSGTRSLFLVSAGRFIQDAQTGAPGTFAPVHWQLRASASNAPPQHVNGMWAAPYIIRGIPLNERLQILPQYLSGLLRPINNNEQAVFRPSREVELSPSVPALTDVDFEMTFEFTGVR